MKHEGIVIAAVILVIVIGAYIYVAYSVADPFIEGAASVTDALAPLAQLAGVI